MPRLFVYSLLLTAAVQAQKPIVDLGTAAEGRIVPGDGLVAVAAPGVITELKIKAGDEVKEGDLLAVLNGMEAAQAAVKVAEARAEAANSAVVLTQEKVAAAQSTRRAAQNQIEIAQAQLAEAQAGVLVAQRAMASALAEHDAASANLTEQIAEYQRVIDELDPPRRDKEDLTVKQNLLRLEIAKLARTRPALEAKMQAQVGSAQAASELASRQVSLTNNQLNGVAAEVTVANQELERMKKETAVAQAAIDQARAEAKAFEIRSPLNGAVITINAQPGEAVGPNGLCFLGDTSNMFVEAQVYVDDIRRVKLGQAATISGAAIGEALKGKVTEIGLMVSPANLYTPDPTVFTDRRVVPVRIALDEDTRAARLIYAQVTVKISSGA